MKLVSTAGRAPAVDLRTALFQGLAPDGGLYVPAAIEPLGQRQLEGLREGTLPDVAAALARRLLQDELPPPAVEDVVRAALDFPIPLVPIGEDGFVLELFHGPTLAFKDVGARFMARLVARLRADGEEMGALTVLVATSGDTGGAVASAFAGVPKVHTVVLFPEGRVTPTQERQFSTLGPAVTAVAVRGSFDDCQRLVKEAFRDEGLSRSAALTSANSINIGRLLPQIFYYFWAWAQLPPEAREIVVSVPSGNLGNLTAGLMARKLGLPVGTFVAATNVNDVLVEYLGTGELRPRGSVHTLSSAMDVGDPSNFARISWLYGGRVERVRRDVVGSRHDDVETRACIGRVFQDLGYLLCPHSAVGYLALERARSSRPGAVGITLATAHPAKFAEVVEPIIGRSVPLPPQLADALARERRVVRVRPELGELRDVILARS